MRNPKICIDRKEGGFFGYSTDSFKDDVPELWQIPSSLVPSIIAIVCCVCRVVYDTSAYAYKHNTFPHALTRSLGYDFYPECEPAMQFSVHLYAVLTYSDLRITIL